MQFRDACICQSNLISSALNRAKFVSFNLIYWTSLCNIYFLVGSLLENLEKNTAKVATAGLGSIGLMTE